MKMMYLLQTVKGLDLGYSFRLFTYGPYDSQVLDDLNFAERDGVVRSETFQWQGGSGYVIKAGPNSEQALSQAKGSLPEFDDALAWVTTQFGSRTASDLEVVSTIIFVDRAYSESGEKISSSELAKRVHEIKPHHSEERISTEISALTHASLLNAVKSRLIASRQQ